MTGMKLPLAITGYALLTPLDAPDRDTWQAIAADQRVEDTRRADDRLLDPDTRWDRSIRMGLAAARRALDDRELGSDGALFCGTSKGPISIALRALEKMRHGEALCESDARQVAMGPSAMGSVLAGELGIGSVHTSVAACASGMHALHRAAQALWHGECRRALVVAADASLHPLFEGSFARLGVLAPADNTGTRRCDPFSDAGKGFFIAEGAAALLLERRESPRDGPVPQAWLEESWLGADSTGLIAIDPQSHSLRQGLAHCAADGGHAHELAFVHAHATGTEHDAFELQAIRWALSPTPPVFSSKGFLGHSLGAAGLVSVVLSIQCHTRGRTLAGEFIEADSTSLTIAQGFGGHIGIVRLRG